MSKTTTNPAPQNDSVEAKNEAVQHAFFKIIDDIKTVLPGYSSEYFRTFIQVDYSSLGIRCQQGFFSPLIHIQLEDVNGYLFIVFSRNLVLKYDISNELNNLLSRIVYSLTAEANTKVNIEDRLIADAYKIDDFRQANNLVLKGFKDGKKVTV